MSEHKLKKQGRSRPRRRWRVWAFAAIVVAVLGAAAWLLKPVLWPASPAVGEVGENVVTIQADMAGFSLASSSHESHAPGAPVVIKAKVGEPLTVRLVSLDNRFHTDGGGKHQFAIDELGLNIIAPPEGVSEATFTPAEPGVYEFYCDICCGGRANPTMRGKLIVEG